MFRRCWKQKVKVRMCLFGPLYFLRLEYRTLQSLLEGAKILVS